MMDADVDDRTLGTRNQSWIVRTYHCGVGLLCVLVVIATIFTLLARYHWVADLLANLRVQQVIGVGISVAASLLARRYRLATIALACLLIHLFSMWPQVQPMENRLFVGNHPIRVMTVNVLASNQSHQRVVEEVNSVDPDIFAVIELSRKLQRVLEIQLAERYPYRFTRAQEEGNFGIGLFSKYPYDQVDAFSLNEEILSIETLCHGYRIIATHPVPPMGNRLFRSRNDHLALLAGRIDRSSRQAPEYPTIMMGDLNLTPWSPHFSRLEKQSGLLRAKRGFAITPTWYARGSSLSMGLVIDHLLISRTLRCADYRVGPDIGSDHRSVSALIVAAD